MLKKDWTSNVQGFKKITSLWLLIFFSKPAEKKFERATLQSIFFLSKKKPTEQKSNVR